MVYTPDECCILQCLDVCDTVYFLDLFVLQYENKTHRCSPDNMMLP